MHGRELYIVATKEVAHLAGFVGPLRRHREMPGAVCWILQDDEPDALRGLGPFSRVFVTDGASRWAHGAGLVVERRLHEALCHAKAQLRAPPMIWMEF